MNARDLRAALKAGDLRTNRQCAEIVDFVAEHPESFPDLFEAIFDTDRGVRLRAADAVEKLTRTQPPLLQPWKRALLENLWRFEDKELRWHIAQILPRLKLTVRERTAAIDTLTSWLDDPSSIVKTSVMQALTDFAMNDAGLAAEIRPLIERLTRTGTPAMRARGRKLLSKLS